MALLRSDIINKEFILTALRLCEKTKHVELESITTGFPVEGGFQDVLPVQVTARVRGREKNYKWISKLAPRSDTIGSAGLILGIWEKEIKIYREVLPFFDYIGESLDLEVPVHPSLVHASLHLQKECILVTDISELGFEPASFPLPRPFLMLAVEWLAKFHAIGYKFISSGHDTQWLVDPVPYAGRSSTNLVNLIRHLETTESSVMVEYASRLENLFSSEAYAKICKDVFSQRAQFATLCHGRPTARSLLVWETDGSPLEAVFVDLQEARLCQPATDLAVLLYTSTDRQFRKEELSNVLKAYHGALQDSFLQLGVSIDTYPFSQLVEDYQEAVVPAVGIAVNLIPGLIGTGDETDSDGSETGKYSAVLGDILEELVEMEKI